MFAPKLFGNDISSKSLPHAKIQLYLPSQSSSAIFQSFYQTEGIVKEVLSRFIQMSWTFPHSFVCSYYHTPPNFSPIQSSMWAQGQIFNSVNIFRSWSKYILYCFINSKKLSDHAPTQITYLHQIWGHFIKKFSLQNYSKFLDREDVCEASTILDCPFGMKFLQHHYMSKSSWFTKFQSHPIIYVSTGPNLWFWQYFQVVKQVHFILLQKSW